MIYKPQNVNSDHFINASDIFVYELFSKKKNPCILWVILFCWGDGWFSPRVSADFLKDKFPVAVCHVFDCLFCCLHVYCVSLVPLAEEEGIAFGSVCLSVCLFVWPHRTFMFFSATACRIETKFSPLVRLLMYHVFMLIRTS